MSLYTLTQVNPIYGKEISNREISRGLISIVFEIYPLEDLTIDQSCNVELQLPLDFSTSGHLQIFLPDTIPFLHSSHNELLHDNQLIIPWLQETNYDISVWVFTIRNLLKRPDYPPWTTPLALRNHFFPVLLPSSTVADGTIRTTAQFIYGAGRTKGSRPYMEDVDIFYDAISISKGMSIQILGVFDGHGGKQCAEFLAEELPVVLSTLLKSSKYGTISEALYASFLQLDASFLRSEGSSSGSTGSVFVWREEVGEGYLAHVGDTRAVLSRRGKAVDMSLDHKATDPEVIARVACQGGRVTNGRIEGLLAVGRAFGDSILKMPRSKQNLLDVSPDIVTYVPQDGDEFIVIASDGLYDVMTSQAVVDMVYTTLTELGVAGGISSGYTGETSTLKARLDDLCMKMAKHAFKELNSKDNITVTIALLDRRAARRVSVVLPAPTVKQQESFVARETPKKFPEVDVAKKEQTEDDLMDFLMDDANF